MITEIPEHLKELADKCNPKHVQVIQAILSGEHKNNTRAYMSIYPDASSKSASELVNNLIKTPRNADLFEALRDHELEKGILTRLEAMKILTDMATTSMGDLIDFHSGQIGEDENGKPIFQSTWSFKESEELTDAQKRSISELVATKDGLKIKQHDQKAAIKQLAEMSGWEAAKEVKHSGHITHIESEYVEPTD